MRRARARRPGKCAAAWRVKRKQGDMVARQKQLVKNCPPLQQFRKSGPPRACGSFKFLYTMGMNTQSSRGFSLIELLLVLGIIAVLLVAAFVVYPQVRDRNQANKAITDMTTIRANVTNLYASRGGRVTGLNNHVARAAKIFPASMYPDPSLSLAYSPWGSLVSLTVFPAPYGTMAQGTVYMMIYNDVPPGVCLPLINGVQNTVLQVAIDGVTVKAVMDGVAYDPGAAAAACNKDTNNITFFSAS